MKVWDALDFLALALLHSPAARATYPLLWIVFIAQPMEMASVAARCRSRPAGMEAAARTRKHAPHTRPIHAHPPRIRPTLPWAAAVSQETAGARMGTADRPSVRGQPVGLSPLRIGNARAGRHHRGRRGEEDPSPPDQDWLPASWPGSLAVELIVQSIDPQGGPLYEQKKRSVRRYARMAFSPPLRGVSQVKKPVFRPGRFHFGARRRSLIESEEGMMSWQLSSGTTGRETGKWKIVVWPII